MSRWKLAIFAGLGTFLVCFGSIVGIGVAKRQTTDMPVAAILDSLAGAAHDMIGEKVAPNIVVATPSLDGLQLTYNYTVIEGSHVDHKLARKTSQTLQRKVCRDRMMRKAVEGGAEIRYSYLSRTRKELLAVKVDKGVCANLA